MSGIILIITALVMISFFSGMEVAFVRSDKLRIEVERKHGAIASEIIRLFSVYSTRFFSAMLTGKIISLVIFISVSFLVLLPVLSSAINHEVLIIACFLVYAIILFLLSDSLIPSTLCSAYPNLFLKYFSIPGLFFFLLLYPVSDLFIRLSAFFSKAATDDQARNMEELIFAKINTDNLTENDSQIQLEAEPGVQNIKILRNALDFSSVKLRDIMVPRTEIEAVPGTGSFDQLREKFISTRYSRILVYNETIDNITGYADVKDTFRNTADITSLIRKLAIVPETMTADRLLRMFVEEGRNIALVVDEFGGTSGMVTTEDLLEQIVGDIEDEHDTNDLIEKKVKENEYIFSGRLEIDYLNEKYDLDLPESDDYATLAGMILYYYGSIPGNTDVIRIGNIVIKVLRASMTRLELVNLRIEQK